MDASNRIAHRNAGFTLLEVLIAVVIIALLTAVALPSFMDSIRKGRRSEAFSALSALQQAQERYRGNFSSYGTLSALGINTTTGPNGYYALSVVSPTATGYELVADSTSAGANSSQRNDGSCAKLGVQVNGGTILYASCSACDAFSTWAARDTCWSR